MQCHQDSPLVAIFDSSFSPKGLQTQYQSGYFHIVDQPVAMTLMAKATTTVVNQSFSIKVSQFAFLYDHGRSGLYSSLGIGRGKVGL